MNRSMNRMGRGLVPALAVIALPLLVGARAVDATAQRGAIPGAASQSGGIACLAKPALADRLAFASLDDARRILARPDSYSRQLSVFDRGAHLRTTEPTTTQDYLRFAADAARAWTPDEEAYWSTLASGLNDAIAGLNLRIPQMSMVKTSGLEQFNAAYTRNRAIVLPERRVALAGDTRRDFFLLAHELFHVLSGENPAQRRALYALLGFQAVANFEYPLELESRRITNPNTGAHLDDALGVQTASGPADVVPVFQSRVPLEEFIELLTAPPAPGPPPFFAALAVVLVPVDLESGDVRRAADGSLVTYDFGNTDWPSRMLRNSSYILHPEELMAENFALLMEWRKDGVMPTAVPGGPGEGFPVNDVGLLRAVQDVLTAGCS